MKVFDWKVIPDCEEAAWQESCKEIDGAEGRQKMFKITKQME